MPKQQAQQTQKQQIAQVPRVATDPTRWIINSPTNAKAGDLPIFIMEDPSFSTPSPPQHDSSLSSSHNHASPSVRHYESPVASQPRAGAVESNQLGPHSPVYMKQDPGIPHPCWPTARGSPSFRLSSDAHRYSQGPRSDVLSWQQHSSVRNRPIKDEQLTRYCHRSRRRIARLCWVRWQLLPNIDTLQRQRARGAASPVRVPGPCVRRSAGARRPW